MHFTVHPWPWCIRPLENTPTTQVPPEAMHMRAMTNPRQSRAATCMRNYTTTVTPSIDPTIPARPGHQKAQLFSTLTDSSIRLQPTQALLASTIGPRQPD